MDKLVLKAIQAMFKILGIRGKEYVVNQVYQSIMPIVQPLMESEMKLKSVMRDKK